MEYSSRTLKRPVDHAEQIKRLRVQEKRGQGGNKHVSQLSIRIVLLIMAEIAWVVIMTCTHEWSGDTHNKRGLNLYELTHCALSVS